MKRRSFMKGAIGLAGMPLAASSVAGAWSAMDDRNAFLGTFFDWMNLPETAAHIEPFIADALQVELFGLGGMAREIHGKSLGLKALQTFQSFGSGLSDPPTKENIIVLPGRVVYATKSGRTNGSGRGVLGGYRHDLVFDFRLSEEFATAPWPPFAVTFIAALEV